MKPTTLKAKEAKSKRLIKIGLILVLIGLVLVLLFSGALAEPTKPKFSSPAQSAESTLHSSANNTTGNGTKNGTAPIYPGSACGAHTNTADCANITYGQVVQLWQQFWGAQTIINYLVIALAVLSVIFVATVALVVRYFRSRLAEMREERLFALKDAVAKFYPLVAKNIEKVHGSGVAESIQRDAKELASKLVEEERRKVSGMKRATQTLRG